MVYLGQPELTNTKNLMEASGKKFPCSAKETRGSLFLTPYIKKHKSSPNSLQHPFQHQQGNQLQSTADI